MRTIWNGTLHFGLVRIPVGLAPTSSGGDISLRTLHRECGTPVRQARWCPVHERVVESEELVKGWEIAPGEFVLVEEEELAAVESDAPGRAVELLGFVEAAAVDPVALDRIYFLAPSESPIGRRPYRVFSGALAQTKTAALVRFTAWGKERIALVRPLGPEQSTLVLHTLRYAEELCSPEEIDRALAGEPVAEKEAKLARQLLRRFAPVDPAAIENAYNVRVRRLLEDKVAGRQIVRQAPTADAAEEPPPVDLAAALRKSMRAAPAAKKPRRAAAKT